MVQSKRHHPGTDPFILAPITRLSSPVVRGRSGQRVTRTVEQRTSRAETGPVPDWPEATTAACQDDRSGTPARPHQTRSPGGGFRTRDSLLSSLLGHSHSTFQVLLSYLSHR